MFRLLRLDYKMNGMTWWSAITGIFTLNPFWLIVLYRISHALYRRRIPYLPYVFQAMGKFIYGADIHPASRIGGGLRFAHTHGIVIGPGAEIGMGVQIFQNVKIGGRAREKEGRNMPRIHGFTSIFAGATVLGPITVETGASIGAGAVVLRDVERFTVVAGNPAKVVGRIEKSSDVENTLYNTASVKSAAAYLDKKTLDKLLHELLFFGSPYKVL